jgi:predicted flavoprotein YhiN
MIWLPEFFYLKQRPNLRKKTGTAIGPGKKIRSGREGHFNFTGLQTLDSFLTLAPHFLQTYSGWSLFLKSFFSQAFLDMFMDFPIPCGKEQR